MSIIRDSEQLHPFLDANCRVFGMLIFNHLLIKNGFPPVIQGDPNRFDGYSIDELILCALSDMQNTIDGEKKLYGVTTEEMLSVATPKEREYFKDLQSILKKEEDKKSALNSSIGLFADSGKSLPKPEEILKSNKSDMTKEKDVLAKNTIKHNR